MEKKLKPVKNDQIWLVVGWYKFFIRQKPLRWPLLSGPNNGRLIQVWLYIHICIHIHVHTHANTYVFLNWNVWRMEFVESYKALSSNPTLAFYCTLSYAKIMKIRIMYNLHFLFHKSLDIYPPVSKTQFSFSSYLDLTLLCNRQKNCNSFSSFSR